MYIRILKEKGAKIKMLKKSKGFYFVIELMFATSLFITICLIVLNIMHYYRII